MKQIQSESESNNPNFVPRLNLQDICSDITAPSQSIDYSFQSSEQKSIHLNPFQFAPSHCSIACDTHDLGMDPSHIACRTAPHGVEKTCRLTEEPSARYKSLPHLATSALGGQSLTCEIHTPASTGLSSSSQVIIIQQGTCEHEQRKTKTNSTDKVPKKNKWSSKVLRHNNEIYFHFVCFRIFHLLWNPWMLQQSLLSS